jgi:putative ABC transport system ATP-binding protein
MINLHRVEKTYSTDAGAFTALRAIDLDIASGEFVTLVGKSGSGKTTLLNVIAAIDAPSSGTVTVAGTDLQTMNESRLAVWRGRTVGVVFQFFQLLPTLTAAENVMLPMDFCRVIPAAQRRKRAMELLDRFGVARHADKLPSMLSGGEQQRVAIARALANEPPIVLADEPTGNLDSSTAGDVLELFRLMAAAGTTVVIATHDSDVTAISDRTIELADGVMVRSVVAA